MNCPSPTASTLRELNRFTIKRGSVPVGRSKVSRRTPSTSMYDRRKGRPRQILVSLFCLCALGYFAYHAIVGKRGFEARSRLMERSRQLGSEIERLEAARTRLEREVRLLDA